MSISIDQWDNHTPLRADRIANIDPLRIDRIAGIEPVRIGEIAPAAIHLKEVNNIDPITIESLSVSEVKNIDPIVVAKFNVTHLPTVNLSVRQLPALDMNVRRLPPISVGLNQDIHVPSNYTVRGRLFGIEVFRLNMSGHTAMIPKERAEPACSTPHQQSFVDVRRDMSIHIPERRPEMEGRVGTCEPLCGESSGDAELRPSYHGLPGPTMGPGSPFEPHVRFSLPNQ